MLSPSSQCLGGTGWVLYKMYLMLFSVVRLPMGVQICVGKFEIKTKPTGNNLKLPLFKSLTSNKRVEKKPFMA